MSSTTSPATSLPLAGIPRANPWRPTAAKATVTSKIAAKRRNHSSRRAQDAPLPTRMRAACLTAYGDPEVLQVREVAVPTVGPRDVLIEVHAASVNPIDWKIRKGYQRAVIRYDLPHVLGLDASGVVVAVGSRVTRFKLGDEVYTTPTHRRSGTYAEYISCDEREVGRKPQNLSHAQAATVPLAGLTAYQCLYDATRLKAGERVLVQAGSGGVGTFAIQMAKHLGAHVATTCSPRNEELVRSIGADEVIDYRSQRFDELLSDYDVVLDTLGGEQRERAWSVLARGGRLVTVVSDMPASVKKHGPVLGALASVWGMVGFFWHGWRHGKSGHYVLKKSSGVQLDEMARLMEDGAFEPVIDRTFSLDDIAEAHRYSETGRARGKIVIAIR